ncbi:MAG TPA: PAS domain S-box protein [Blastocatellia bacterium]|nr:PAS domain S-box protein [Blastocatellia bacterium]
MGKLIREMDWSKTPLGPIESWPQSLRTTVNLCLASNFPISIAWGPQRTQIYNDGYWPICGAKHPHSMGQDFRECWYSAWPAIGEAFERASAGETSFLVNQRVFIDRNGYLEETFFTYSFSPIRDETGEVGGLFHPVTEMTDQTLAERRLKVLRDLADRTADAKTVEDACTLIAAALGGHELDMPFALLYLFDADGKRATLAASCGIQPGTAISPVSVDLSQEALTSWPLAEVARAGRLEEVNDLEKRFGHFSCGPYPEPPKTAYALPIILPGLEQTFGALVAGVSSRRALDDAYRTFYLMLGDSVSSALANARAYEEERKRAEALAEIDRAKTVFFSNVSHEFRTPLTLMLGPLEDTLAEDGLPPQAHDRLEVARRNSLRLLKLVNTLLDFSRIEAGRIQAVYEPVDLAKFTTDLASVFRSTVERAGIELVVDCQPLSEPVYVDREMWEKIVLNLLSNAFKFTFEGEIEVRLRIADRGLRIEEIRESGGQERLQSTIDNPRYAILTVRDTGTGIPEAELPRLFERFHRVKDARGRSYEGSGIGLALVHELVKLHCGDVRVESEVDRGSEFTVMIPLGKAHLPSERIGAARSLAPTALRGEAYVEEALRWLPANAECGMRNADSFESADYQSTRSNERIANPHSAFRIPHSRILLADDNADMREYVRGLLSGQYEVEAVADGEAALKAVRESAPDLVLSDVMMPKLDGIGLLRELRADERLKTVPVILLSARAGEEARVEGMEVGADDYLVKPFSARELLARVDAHLKLHRVRCDAEGAVRESERRFREMIDALPAAVYTTDAEGRLTHFNPAAVELSGRIPELGTDQWCISWKLYYPDGAPMPHDECPMAVALKEGRVVRGAEAIAERPDGTRVWFEPYPTPLCNAEGKIIGGINMLLDITERKRREQVTALLSAIVNSSDDAILSKDLNGVITSWNKSAERMFGYTAQEAIGQSCAILVPADRLHEDSQINEKLRRGEGIEHFETVRARKDGSTLNVTLTLSPLRDAAGRIVGASKIARDITERKKAEEKLAEASQRLHAHVNNSPLAAVEFDPEWRLVAWSEGAERMFGWSAAEILGKRIKDLLWVHEDDAVEVDALCADMIAGQRLRYNHVNRNYRKDGSVIECEWYNSVLRDVNGKMISLNSQVLDVTERKRAEEALREREQHYRALTELSPQVVFMSSPDGYLTYINQHGLEFSGRTLEEMLGEGWADSIQPESRERIINIWKTSVQEVSDYEVEIPFILHDGSVHRFYTKALPVKDDAGAVLYWIGTAVDVEDLKRAEDELRKSEARYRATFDNAAVGIAHIGLDGRWLRFNDAVCAITGYSREELVTKTFADITHPDDIDADWAQARQVLRGEIPTYSMEKRYLCKDGSIAWVCLTVSLTRDAAGAPQNFISVIEDIGERKQAEEALRGSEERFRAIVSQATAGIVETDLTGRLIFANQRYCEIVGYSETELRALRMHDITHPDDLPASVVLFNQLANGGSDFVVEKRYVRKDGGGVWVNNSVNAVRDTAGRVRSIVAVSLDITERRRAQMALAEALALNRTITDNTQSCLWMMDTQGRGTFANHASERISGFKPEELIGQVLHEKVHHTHPDGTPFPIEECPLDRALPLQEAVVGYEDVFVHKDGHFYPVRCAGRPIVVNGEPIGTVIEVQDITEERRAAAERERLLEEERRHGRNLQRLNAASVAINAATSIEEVVRLINEKARELTGARMAVVNLVPDGDWKRSRTTPSLSGEYAAWDDYDAQVTGERIYNLVAREKRTMRMTQAELESHPTWRGLGVEAGKHPLLRGWMAAPLLGGDGECIGVVQLSDKWIGGAAGEFHESDEALMWQLAQVASVALENQQLYEHEQEARQMAEQATRAKDEFLAVVSHELRSPLNAILGWNRLLRSRRGDDPQIARVTETVESSGQAQLRLIEDLLDTARIISGKMRLETQPVELVGVIASALDAVRPAADSKGIVIVQDFSLETGQTSCQITGDPDRLQQVVWNLVSNAIKFTPDGGRVWVGLRRGGPGVQIIVRDTGQGISPDLLPYVFDRFKQGDSSVSRRFGGLGLGLALVKHLVELHGGSVMVESLGEGQGATFTVGLPAPGVKGDLEAKSRGERKTVVAWQALHGLRPASLSGVRALVVEDEAGARELITLALEQQEALVTGVDSAAAALAALESQLDGGGAARAPFDVLISDIGMPGGDGYELIRRVRAHADERVSRIRAVAITAYARTEDRMQALQAGFQMHVPKPVDEAELTTVIAALIGRTPGQD